MSEVWYTFLKELHKLISKWHSYDCTKCKYSKCESNPKKKKMLIKALILNEA